MNTEEIADLSRRWGENVLVMRNELALMCERIRDEVVTLEEGDDPFRCLVLREADPFQRGIEWLKDVRDALRAVNQIDSTIPFRHEVVGDFYDACMSGKQFAQQYFGLHEELRQFEIWASVKYPDAGGVGQDSSIGDDSDDYPCFGLQLDMNHHSVHRLGEKFLRTPWQLVKNDDSWDLLVELHNRDGRLTSKDVKSLLGSEASYKDRRSNAKRRLDAPLESFDLVIRNWCLEETSNLS